MIGTANSLTGALAPFETAINAGIDVAVAEINADGGVDGRLIEVLHVDAKSDLNLVGDGGARGDREGRRRGRADVRRRPRRARARVLRTRKASSRSPARARPGIGKQAIGPLTFNTYAGAPTEGAISAEFAYDVQGWRSAYLMCDQLFEYMKVLCESFETRWRSSAATVVGRGHVPPTDPSLAAQVTRLGTPPSRTSLLLALVSRAARPRSKRSAPPSTARSSSLPRSRARSGSRRRPICRTLGCRPSARATATTRATR